MTSDPITELQEAGRRIMRFWNAGDVDAAISLAVASNARAASWFGEYHPSYVGGLSTLGRIYFEAGRLEEAEAELLECADVEYRNSGALSHGFAGALERLSTVCGALPGREHDARNLKTAAMRIMMCVISGQADDELEQKLRGLHRNLRRMRLDRHTRAARLAEESRDRASAEIHYRRALASVAEDERDSSPSYSLTQLSLSGLISDLGRVHEAEEIGEAAYAALQRILPSNDLHLARALCDIALNRRHMGRADEAVEAYEAALRIARACTDPQLVDARASLERRALTGLAQTYLEFAHLAREEGRRRSLEMYRELDPFVRRQGLESRDYGQFLANVAHLHRDALALGSAYGLLEASTRIFERLGEAAVDNYHTNLLNLGGLALMLGRLDEAKAHLETSLAWHEEVFGLEHEEVAKCRAELAVVAALRSDKSGFADHVEALHVADDRRIAIVLPGLEEADAIRAASQIWFRAEQCFLGAVELGLKGEAELTPVYNLLLARRGVVLAALIERARASATGDGRDALPFPAISLSDVRDGLPKGGLVVDFVRLAFERLGPLPGVGLDHDRYHIAVEDLEDATPILHFNFAGLRIEEIPQQSGRYLAFVIPNSPAEPVRLIDLGRAEALERLVAAYRDALRKEHAHLEATDQLSTQESDEIGRALRAAALDPIMAGSSAARSLYVVADGKLGEAPLEGLPLDSGGYVIDQLQVTYLHGASSLARPPWTEGSGSPALVIGNPDYGPANAMVEPAEGGLEAGAFEPLPGSEAEAKAVAAILGVEPLLGPKATLAAIRSTRAPDVLHLATHGFFLNDEEPGDPRGAFNWAAALRAPLRRTGLALAGANSPSSPDGGVLFAEDVLALDLMGTKLVTLSACHTASGEMQIGEGVLGLSRAFAVAGANDVVMSCWETPDAISRRLMTAFYTELRKGRPPASALRAAKMQVRRFLPHAFYWNAFLYQGGGKVALVAHD